MYIPQGSKVVVVMRSLVSLAGRQVSDTKHDIQPPHPALGVEGSRAEELRLILQNSWRDELNQMS